MRYILDRLHASDQKLIFLFLVLLFFGLLMVYSSSGIVAKDSFFYFKKQLLWAVIGILCYLFFLTFDYNKLRGMIGLLMGGTLVLLILLFFVGREVGGARRWLEIGMIRFQPSEIAKFSLIIFLADYLDRKKSRIRSFSNGLLPPLTVIAIYCILIALEPDIGIPAIIVSVSFVLLFVSGAKLMHLMGILLCSVPVFIWSVLSVPYRRERFFAFLDPWDSKNESAYQLVQSLLSLGSGGIMGKGLGQSELKKFYLPGQHTDFIFSILGEEIGVIGTVIIVLAFTYLLFIGYKIARTAPDLFSRLLAMGLTLSIVLQAYFNIAVCCGCLPTKGISLPFISYGGSSLVITLSMVGILSNITQYRRRFVRGRYIS